MHALADLYKSVIRGVALDGGIGGVRFSVERGRTYVQIVGCRGAAGVLFHGRRGVVNLVAVDIYARGKIPRRKELGNDRLRFRAAVGKLGLFRNHQRTFDGRAELVVFGIRFLAVDKVNVIFRFRDESAVSDERTGACQRHVRLPRAAARDRAYRQSRRYRRHRYCFEQFFHHVDLTPVKHIKKSPRNGIFPPPRRI